MRLSQISATLPLAALITILHIVRLSGHSAGAFINANLNVVSWELLYSQPWRLLTSTFLHQDLPHFLGNLFFLLLFGRKIERSHGWAVMLAVFFGGLVTSHVLEITIMHSFVIGISGGSSPILLAFSHG
jgi:membrane associated rhomboid family serine protease